MYLYWFEYSDIRSTWFIRKMPCNRIINIISYNDIAINNAHGIDIIVSLYSWNCSKVNTTSGRQIENVGTCECVSMWFVIHVECIDWKSNQYIEWMCIYTLYILNTYQINNLITRIEREKESLINQNW